MSAIVITDPVIEPESSPEQREHANHALCCVLDAEIEALKARLLQRSADAEAASGQDREDQECQVGWLLDSLAKLEARRRALC
jgi:hypothetical protein